MTARSARRTMRPVKQNVARKCAPPPEKSDEALIRDCVTFAQSVALYDANVDAFPGDLPNDGAVLDRLAERASRALEGITRKPAATLRGLLAKAKAVPAVIHHAAESLDHRDERFFASLAADVRALIGPMVEKREVSELTAPARKLANGAGEGRAAARLWDRSGMRYFRPSAR